MYKMEKLFYLDYIANYQFTEDEYRYYFILYCWKIKIMGIVIGIDKNDYSLRGITLC